MTVFQRVGVTSGGSLDVAATYVSLQAGSDGQVVLHDYGFGVSSQWHVQNNGASRASNDRVLAEAPRVEVTIAGREGGLLRDALNGGFDSWNAGERSAETMFLGETAHGFDAVTVLAAQVGGRQMVYAATQNSAGLTAFQYNGAELSSPASYTGAYSDFISDIAIVETGGGDYLFTASATQHGITSYGMSATGALSALGALSAEDSLPVATLDAAQVGGNAFLIAAAAGTSSLTVLSVSNTGQLAVADHIMDGLDTRFQGVSQLEVVQMGAQSLVMASGMDDGLSLFRLTSEGRLIHVDTIADSTTTALDGISGLEAVTHSTGFNVFTTSASEAGMTQFRVDFAPNGIIAKADGMLQGTAGADILTAGDAEGARIQAGAGDDILIDGADENRLQGGAGADIFVFIQDGERDWIDDFDAAHDTIDLSAWEGLTAANQLDIKSNDNGARVLFGEERLDVRTADATPLTAQQVMNAAAVFLSHVDVILGPRLVSEAPPAPPPTVTPEQSTASPPHVGEGTESTSEWDVNLANDQHPDDQPGGEPEFVTDENPDAAAGSLGLTLQGGDGDDVLTGSALDDAISGGAGNDTITGDAGNDMIAGAVGDDVVRGGDGNDSNGGGLGNDTIEGGEAMIRLVAGATMTSYRGKAAMIC